MTDDDIERTSTTYDESLHTSSNSHSESSRNSIVPTQLNGKLQFVIFMIMGSGANWVFPTALSQEIPYLEDNQPEGLCLATYMNASVNIGLIFLIIYVFIYYNMYKIPYCYSVPVLLMLSSIGCFLTAGTYSITFDDTSILLYISCAIGGIVGALSAVIMSPFLMSYEKDMISAARAGGSALILLTALIAVAQSPGSVNRISVSVYMVIFGIILSFPIFAYYYIIKTNIGLRRQGVEPPAFEMSNFNDETDNPMNDESIDDLVSSFKSASPTTHNEVTTESLELDYDSNKSIIDRNINLFLTIIIPQGVQKSYPWLVKCTPYMLTVAWIDFNNFGVLSAALPFAIANCSRGSGSANLAIAYEVGAFCLVSGDLSTTKFRLSFKWAIFLFTISSFIIYLAAFNVPGFDTEATAPILIILYCLTQFVEAHILTSSYRTCATEFPIHFREDASRTVGICDQGRLTFVMKCFNKLIFFNVL